MKRLAPLTLALSLAYSAAQAGTFSSYDDASLQVGQQLMQSNGLLLRNGDDVWKRIREGYQLTEVDSELVRRHERMYSAKPEYLKRTLTRGGIDSRNSLMASRIFSIDGAYSAEFSMSSAMYMSRPARSKGSIFSALATGLPATSRRCAGPG